MPTETITTVNAHSQLNPNKCFKKIHFPVANHVLTHYHPPKDWIKKLSELIFQNLTVESKYQNSANSIKKTLEDHLDFKFNAGHSIYHYPNKDELKTSLIQIYAILSQEVTDTEVNFDPTKDESKTLLAEKLYEGVSNCTPGFHNRLNLIWMNWRIEANFGERLQKIRNEIVQSVAANYISLFSQSAIMEAHLYNSITKVAADTGYGNSVVNTTDTYNGTYDPPTVQGMLQKAFQRNYTPLLIIKRIEEQLYSTLTYIAEYQGNKPEGYVGYLKWNEILDKVFPSATPRDISYWFVTNETSEALFCEMDDPRILDIDWSKIRAAILQELVKERFFLPKIKISAPDDHSNPTNREEFQYWIENFATLEELSEYTQQIVTSKPGKQLELLSSLSLLVADNHPFKQQIPLFLDKKIVLTQLLTSFSKKLISPQFVLQILQTMTTESLPALLISQKTSLDETLLTLLLQKGNNELIESLFNLPSIKAELSSQLHAYIRRQLNMHSHDPLQILFRYYTFLPNTEQFNLEISKHINQRILTDLFDRFVKKQVSPEFVLLSLKCISLDDLRLMLAQKKAGNQDFFTLMLQQGNTKTNADFINLLIQRGLQESLKTLIAKHLHDNSLLNVTLTNPPMVKPIINIFGEFYPHKIPEIFHSHLLYALKNEQKIVKPLVNALDQLTKEQLTELFKKPDHHNDDILKLALYHNHESLEPLLRSVSQLEPQEQWRLVNNLLMEIIHQINSNKTYNPTLEKETIALIKGIKPLNLIIQIQLLQKTDHSGKTFLDCIRQRQSTLVPLLEQTISVLFNTICQDRSEKAAQAANEINFSKLPINNPDRILQLLTLRKNTLKSGQPLPPLTTTEINYFNKILSQEHWFKIAMQGLLPIDSIRHQRPAILSYITTKITNTTEKCDAAQTALDSNTALGALFKVESDKSKKDGFFSRLTSDKSIEKLSNILKQHSPSKQTEFNL